MVNSGNNYSNDSHHQLYNQNVEFVSNSNSVFVPQTNTGTLNSSNYDNSKISISTTQNSNVQTYQNYLNQQLQSTTKNDHFTPPISSTTNSNYCNPNFLNSYIPQINSISQNIQNMSLDSNFLKQGNSNKHCVTSRLSSHTMNSETEKSKDLYSMSNTNLYYSENPQSINKSYYNSVPLSTGHTPRKNSKCDGDSKLLNLKNNQYENYSANISASDRPFPPAKEIFKDENPTSDNNYNPRSSSEILNFRMHRNMKQVVQQEYLNIPTAATSLKNVSTVTPCQYNEQYNQQYNQNYNQQQNEIYNQQQNQQYNQQKNEIYNQQQNQQYNQQNEIYSQQQNEIYGQQKNEIYNQQNNQIYDQQYNQIYAQQQNQIYNQQQYNQLNTEVNGNQGYSNYYQEPKITISTPNLNLPYTTQLYENNFASQNSTNDFITNIADINTNNIPNMPPELDMIPDYCDMPYKLPDQDHIVSTLSSIFKQKKLLDKLRLPFGVIYNPLKKIKNIPIISPKEVIRCAKCYAYLNPFSNWVEPMTFVCNLCNRRRTITSDYLIDLSDQSPNNINLTSYIQSSMIQIPMKNCTYDILAPSSFAKYPPKTPCHIILLDMTYKSIEIGYLEILMTSIYEKILNICPNNYSSIAFIGYNKFIHFFSLKIIKENIKIIHKILSDIDDPYHPFDDEIFINPTKNLDNFKKFLTLLPKAIRSQTCNTNNECCMGSAITFAINILKKSGGRILFFNGTKSIIGNGIENQPNLNLKNIQKSENIINNQELLLGLPISNDTFFKSKSVLAGKYSICIDLFYFGFEKYSTLINIISIIYHCGGSLKYYGLFEKSKQNQFIYKFKNDIDNYLLSEYTIDNSVVIRLSRGIEVESYYGNFKLESTGKLFLPYINQDTIISYKFDMDDVPYIYNNYIYIQIAHFYTTINCERRIRITTLPIKIIPENNPILIYNNCNQFAIITIISRFIQLHLSKSKLSDVKQASFNACKDIIIQFYNIINIKFDGKNLLMHKNLCNLISFIHSILNNASLSDNIFSACIDWRINFLEELKTLSVRNLILRLYPKLYSLQNIEYSNFYELIQPLPPSAQFIYQNSLYLLDNGVNIYILIPKDFSSNILQLLFNCNSFNDMPSCYIGIPIIQNELNLKFRQFINYIINKDKLRSFSYFNTIVYKINSNNTCNFFNHLMFDRRPNKLISLNEFYLHLKEEILKDKP